MTAIVADIMRIMETIAPIHLAEDWDNVGLQVGEMGWPVKKIWTALDPTPEVVETACESNVDLLITHHPLIFEALRNVDFSTSLGHIIQQAGKHKMAIFSAHTNLDNANNGLNDILAEKVGLKNVRVLKKLKMQTIYKLVIFIPSKYGKRILDTLIESNFTTKTKEVTVSKELSEKVESEDKIRIETTVHRENLSTVIDTIRSLYPYKDIPYDIYPLVTQETTNGAGRIGDLNQSMKLSSLVDHIRKIFDIESVKVAGNPSLFIDRIAVCSGSGSSLMNEFISSGAQVYISGDLRYHDARLVEQAGLAFIDIGHFRSEFIIVDELKKRLQKIFTQEQMGIIVDACHIEKDPFWLMHG